MFRYLALVAAAQMVFASAVPSATLGPEPAVVCTVGGIGVPAGDTIPNDVPLVVSCFDTAAEAEEFIEAGAPGDYERLVGDGVGVHARAAASTVTIGRVWTGASRTGSELIHWGTGNGCAGVTYGFPSLPSGWNNNIRSAQGYSNCWASHYDGTSYAGSVLTCAPYCANLGFLAAKSSSIVYRPVGTFG